MAVEFQSDFDGYLDAFTGNAVTATIFEVQQSLWDDRVGLIDSWYDIDSGNSTNIKIILDQEFIGITGLSVGIEGFQPVAYIKYKDAPYISHDDRLLVNEITTRQGTTLVPETTYKVKGVENDNFGLVKIILEEEWVYLL